MLAKVALATILIFCAQADSAACAELPVRPAILLQFESDQQVRDLAKNGPAVIFFYAKWCPNCKAAALAFSARWDEVRPGVALIVADYDKQTALKTRYGVTYQDTYVLVGPDGEKRKIWNGGGITALNANTAN